MMRRILVASSLIGTLVLGLAAAPAASANNVAWSVSIGGPGYVVSAGQPAYWGPRPYYGYRPAYVAPPVYYPAPVVYSYPRPYYRPYYVAPRPVYYGPGYYRGY
jgi:hypothetical protein